MFLISGLFLGLTARFSGLILGLTLGLTIGSVELGCRTIIQHYTLRYLLARQGALPFPFSDRKLIDYLDAMVDRRLLSRVGGGWMFIHQHFLEHLAALYEPERG